MIIGFTLVAVAIFYNNNKKNKNKNKMAIIITDQSSYTNITRVRTRWYWQSLQAASKQNAKEEQKALMKNQMSPKVQHNWSSYCNFAQSPEETEIGKTWRQSLDKIPLVVWWNFDEHDGLSPVRSHTNIHKHPTLTLYSCRVLKLWITELSPIAFS